MPWDLGDSATFNTNPHPRTTDERALKVTSHSWVRFDVSLFSFATDCGCYLLTLYERDGPLPLPALCPPSARPRTSVRMMPSSSAQMGGPAAAPVVEDVVPDFYLRRGRGRPPAGRHPEFRIPGCATALGISPTCEPIRIFPLNRALLRTMTRRRRRRRRLRPGNQPTG